ncbi:MAG TPA: glycosyltransferase [Acidimicrobiales bacterium]|nr:glycosyltransferase [Acidimicrobiales bacterium]
MADGQLRVVYLGHCAQLSGAELALLRLLPALRGVEPHVVLAEDGPLVARLRDAGISTVVLPMGSAARHLSRHRVRMGRLPVASVLGSALHVLRLTYELRRLGPDLVHTNTLKAALYGGLAARAARVPVVWHMHDRVAEDYLPRSAVKLVRALARRLPDGVIANSRATLDSLRVVSVPTAVIPGIVYPHQSTAATSTPGGGLRVGMVGRLAPWKGQHVFLTAFARSFPAGGAARAILVGAPLFGEEGYAADLRRQATELGIAGRLEMTGFRDDVASELARLDVLVHASVIPEPFGQVVVEGMAAGLPVVAADAGGPAEIITDEVDGLLVPPGDSAALADVLRRLSADPSLRARLGAAARERARAYEPGGIAERMEAFYRQVLA